MHVKRGDMVKVIAGKDKGMEGKVITAMPNEGKVIVEGVAIVSKHQKARRQGQESGILKMEAPIDASNVMRVCSKCGKAARTGIKILEDGSKVRYCKKCNETFND
ncbi:MAG TPA: 50S ribosomal protein L24 [Candidatus Ornithomonoglobus intestinigallinarum]|uniref:Large ribosomal subunit protein uL24 n=1 Tax=Candidatus Ornithomonoglobus intestinigallinarum TaxID=2840894 RepID=A0A9D1H3P8_9FIRM|nr:50S ribosomal protein L24 [Candidatus Ornithomonoglobus intestinigallinarum]